MGKNLKNEDINNTRLVLFEKHRIYYYPIDKYLCKQKCKVLDDGTYIGTVFCHACIFNIGFHVEKSYIVCKRLTKAING
jgi:hypothetical protein